MSVPRNESKETLAVVTLGGVDVSLIEISYDYKPWNKTGDAEVVRYKYKSVIVGDDDNGIDGLNQCRIVLETLALMDEIDFSDYTVEYLVETVEETASEIAEDLEIHFIYERNGRQREYTPRSLWSPSGGCEWEESASEYDYGWDL